MTSVPPKPRWLRLLPFMLVVPLVAIPTLAVVVLTGSSEGGRLPTAPGSPGGTLHPIAGTFEPDGTTLAACGQNLGCLEQGFGNVAYRQGPGAAVALFEARLETDPYVEQNCHRIAHMIGSAALERFDGDVAKTFALGSAACVSGYYHGILERAFVGASSRQDLARIARGLCDGTGIRRHGFLDYQCRHGLGHGFMIQTGYDLPSALALCAGLGTRWDELTCTSGAFMENANVRFGYRSRWLDEDDPLYPCNELQARFRRSCYLRATTWALQMNRNDFEETARLCDTTGRWKAPCFRGLGRDTVVKAHYGGVDEVLALCPVAGRYLGECLYGAARTFADSALGAGIARAATLCARAPAAHRDRCAAGYGLVVGLLQPTSARRRAACRTIWREHAEACFRAAEAEVDPSGRGAWG